MSPSPAAAPTSPASPPLRHRVLEDVDFWITPGIDGVLFRDGAVIEDSLRFIRPVNAPRERKRGRDITPPRASDLRGEFPEAFLAVDPGWPNYFHWLLLHVPLLRAAGAFVDPRVPALLARYEDHVAVPRPVAFARSVFDQSLEGIAPPRPLQFLAPGAYRARRLHRLDVDSPQRADLIFTAPVWQAIQELARQLRGEPEPGAPRRLYLTRRSAARRELDESADRALQPLLAREGLTPVSLDGRSLADQARLFAGAEIVIAPHGAALANLIFATPGTRVLELNARVRDEPAPRHHFARLAARCGLRYRMLDGSDGGFTPAALAAAWEELQSAPA